jgi:hypothetical protein
MRNMKYAERFILLICFPLLSSDLKCICLGSYDTHLTLFSFLFLLLVLLMFSNYKHFPQHPQACLEFSE